MQPGQWQGQILPPSHLVFSQICSLFCKWQHKIFKNRSVTLTSLFLFINSIHVLKHSTWKVSCFRVFVVFIMIILNSFTIKISLFFLLRYPTYYNLIFIKFLNLVFSCHNFIPCYKFIISYQHLMHNLNVFCNHIFVLHCMLIFSW